MISRKQKKNKDLCGLKAVLFKINLQIVND